MAQDRPRLGDVQSTGAGHGFVVYGNSGRPAVTFGYLSLQEAEDAHAKMSEVLASCKEVTGYN